LGIPVAHQVLPNPNAQVIAHPMNPQLGMQQSIPTVQINVPQGQNFANNGQAIQFGQVAPVQPINQGFTPQQVSVA
jgi:hypothetical protein